MRLRAWVWVGSALALAITGCGDDSGASGDTDTDGSSTGAPTTAGPTTQTPTTGEPTTEPATTDVATTEAPTTESADSSSTSGEEGDSSSGGESDDVCVGFNYLGAVDQVHFLDGPGPVEVECAPKPAPCGGDIEGVWNITASCGYELLPNFFEEICAGAQQQVTGSQSMGTRAFNSDGTFDFDLVNTLEVDLDVDSVACTGLTCEEFATALNGEPEFDMLCEDADGGGCDCVYTLDLPEVGEGTWNTLSDSVLLTVDGELDGSLEYCVTDDRLDMWQPLFSEEANPDVLCDTSRDCEAALGDAYLFYDCIDPADLKKD